MKDVKDKLIRQLEVAIGDQFSVEHHQVTPWASITFSGSRHQITVLFDPDVDIEPLDIILNDFEFAIPNILVADASITSTMPLTYPVEGTIAIIDILLLEDR